MYHKRQHDRVIATTPQETAGAWELCTHESIARVQLLPLLPENASVVSWSGYCVPAPRSLLTLKHSCNLNPAEPRPVTQQHRTHL